MTEDYQPPKRIWLQWSSDDGDGVTWEREQINDDDPEYVLRSDGWRQCAVGQRTTQWCGAAQKLQDERDGLRSALDRITHSYRLLLSRKPVRDADETLAEADRALGQEKP